MSNLLAVTADMYLVHALWLECFLVLYNGAEARWKLKVIRRCTQQQTLHKTLRDLREGEGEGGGEGEGRLEKLFKCCSLFRRSLKYDGSCAFVHVRSFLPGEFGQFNNLLRGVS